MAAGGSLAEKSGIGTALTIIGYLEKIEGKVSANPQVDLVLSTAANVSLRICSRCDAWKPNVKQCKKFHQTNTIEQLFIPIDGHTPRHIKAGERAQARKLLA